MNTKTLIVACLATAMWTGSAAAQDAANVDGGPDWPCIQRKVPELQPAQAWSGPPLDEALEHWRDDPQIARLAAKLAARRTPVEEAQKEIESFAEEAAPEEREEKLTLLFAGIFERLNAERSRIIAGLERYGQRQRALSDQIRQTRIELAEARGGDSEPDDGKVSTPRISGVDATPEDRDNQRFASDLDEKLYWDTRIYDTRRDALIYVCDSPVIIEQRVFSMARAIQGQIEQDP